MIPLKSKIAYVVCLTIFLTASFTYSQSKFHEGFLNTYKTTESFNSFASVSKEVIYLHLNKTDFLEGEQIGFKAYILDKGSGKPSVNTSNLYVQLVDEQNKTVKEKLLKVSSGRALGTFSVDKALKPKNYIIKAFTNWSRNFERSNIFEQKIRIVNNTTNRNRYNEELERGLQVSFMPEGGHLVLNAKNSMGIYVKDIDGLGVSDLSVNLLNSENIAIKTFQLNKKGLAKFFLTPIEEDRFRLSIFYKDKDYIFDLPEAEERGMALILSAQKENLIINLNTNKISLPSLKERKYKLAIHNGSKLKLVRFPKFDTTSIVSKIAKNRLFEGINILTVLDETDTPLLERLYFNTTSRIKYAKSSTIKSNGDSLAIKLNYNDLKADGNLSISILPEQSIANNAHESIASFSLLSSHLSGAVENADDYFKERKTLVDKDLDLVLIVQGWSAYDWSAINYFSPPAEYEFEKGIKVKLTNKKQKARNFIAYPHQGVTLKKLDPSDSNMFFLTDSLYPFKEDKLRISRIDKKGNFIKPFAYADEKVKFYPFQIPSVATNGKALGYKTIDKSQIGLNEEFTLALSIDENIIALDEAVVIENKIKDEQLRTLKAHSFGEVIVFDEKIRNQNIDALAFLSKLRLKGSPAIYLNNVRLNPVIPNAPPNALAPLDGLFSSDIGYVEVNATGLGEGGKSGGRPVVRFFTRVDYSDEFIKPYEYLDFDYPLTFDRPTNFSIPYYSSYSNRQYLQYGVIGWFPDLSLNDKNEVEFKIPTTILDSIKLHIQGVLDNGNFISEERVILLNRLN